MSFFKVEVKKFEPKLKELKGKLQELSQNKKKEGSIFDMLFSRDSEEVSAGSQEELVQKLVKKNAPLNQIRAESCILSQELNTFRTKKINYKHTEESKKLFDQIKDTFEQNCKEIFRKFKDLLEGAGNEEMRKSIFATNKSSNPLSSSMLLNKQKVQVINIDLSSHTSLKDSINLKGEKTNEEKKSQRELKRITQFPSMTNKEVLEAIRVNGSFNYRIEDSYFNNQQEQGPFEFEDGSVYYGHIHEQKRHGRGKAIFKDGAYYEGFWKDDVPYGIGRIIRSNGDMYQGQCINFKAQGKGTFKTLKGDYLYNGDWMEDMKHGKGEEVIPLQFQYKGEFAYNQKHGQGEIRFADGVVYNGDFKEGQITGEGTFDYPNGEKYVGCVKDRQKNGKGCYSWPDGSRFDGYYVNNIPHGKGIFFWPDGYIYSGEWLNGMQHGRGQEIDAVGNERDGIWENGVWKAWI